MTTYILHGGRTVRKLPANDKFFAEFTQSFEKKDIHILLCYWARKVEERDERFAIDEKSIREFSKDKQVTLSAAEDAQDLIYKIGDCDVLYIAGGEYLKLKNEFAKIPNLKDLVGGKLVIGSSAGAFLLAQYSLNSSDEQIEGINIGLGLVPISILCHWDLEDEKEKKIKQLLEHSPKTPLLTLDEGDYAKFYELP